jgi:hypothetical protein
MSKLEIFYFLKEWQTLIGAFLGVFFASIFSFIGFGIKGLIKRVYERKEALRIIEVSITRSMDNVDNIKKSFNDFLDRVESLTLNIKELIDDNNKYFLEETNLPPLRIFLNENLPSLKTKSYYIHNKIIWVTAEISNINSSLSELKELFMILSRKNEFLVTAQVSKKEQKEAYLANLTDFSNIVRSHFMKSLDSCVKLLTEIKVYNDKVRTKNGFWVRWKYEGTSFKSFRNKIGWKRYYQDPSSIDRIDSYIKDEVEKILSTLTPTK